MPDPPTLRVSVMQGEGAYGRHSRIPAAGGGMAIPMLEHAARRIALEAGGRPIVVADYGSSDGKNSLAPMRAAITVLRERIGRERPIIVCHTDLPGNDFSTLIGLIESDPESYGRAGGSFSRQREAPRRLPADHGHWLWPNENGRTGKGAMTARGAGR